MIRLVVSIVLMVILAVFIALNMPYQTTINLFGYILEQISVVAVVILAMVAGIIYSFGLYLTNYFAKRRKAKVKLKTDNLKQKEKEFKIEERKVTKAKSGETGVDEAIELQASDQSGSRKGKQKNRKQL
jgi:uncharacterized integral membrane protein